MNANLERLSENSVKLTVEVSAEEFDKALDLAFEKVVKEVKADGFRPGKMPKNIFIQRFGWASLYNEAIQYAFEETYPLALQQTKVYPTAEPKVDLDFASLEKGKSFTYTAEVDVWPEVHLGEYKGLKVKPLSTRVTKKDVEAEIKHMLESKVENVIKDGPAENGDTVVIDFEGFVDGVPFEGGKAENHSLEIGSGQFIPGFEDQMIGMTCENEKDVVVTFPEDYQATELAGKEATFKVTVHEIKEKVLPEADDELAKDVNIEGVETLDQLKDHIKAQLKSQKENEVENKFFSDLTQALIECCKVEDSEALLNSELDTMLREVEMNLQQQGLSFELYEQFTGKNKDAIKADLTDQAKDRVKLNLILAAIVEAENIEVTDEERNSELETIANTYNRDLEEIKQIFAQNMYQIDADILNRKALDVVKENLKK